MDKVHGLKSQDLRRIAGDAERLHKLLSEGHLPPEGRKRRKSPAQAPWPSAAAKILSVIPRRSQLNTKLTQAYARNVCVIDLRPVLTDQSGQGLKAFLDVFAQLTGAAKSWAGPSGSSAANILRRDEEVMLQLAAAELACLSDLEGAIHHDGWEDA